MNDRSNPQAMRKTFDLEAWKREHLHHGDFMDSHEFTTATVLVETAVRAATAAAQAEITGHADREAKATAGRGTNLRECLRLAWPGFGADCEATLNRFMPIIETEIAGLREPMECKHPRACLVESHHDDARACPDTQKDPWCTEVCTFCAELRAKDGEIARLGAALRGEK